MSDAIPAPTAGSLDGGRAVSPELSAKVAEIKRGRGRPRKDGSAPAAPAGPAKSRPLAPVADAPAPWSPIVAGRIVGAVHDIGAVTTGFAGFRWTPDEIDAVGPLLAEVLDDALPYQGYRVKLAMLVLTVVGIDLAKVRAWREWKAAEVARAEQAMREARAKARGESPAPVPPA